ncbi:hypothetical protein CYMTET_27273, partial [Cymbomonas tetramitiformis]
MAAAASSEPRGADCAAAVAWSRQVVGCGRPPWGDRHSVLYFCAVISIVSLGIIGVRQGGVRQRIDINSDNVPHTSEPPIDAVCWGHVPILGMTNLSSEVRQSVLRAFQLHIIPT